MIRSGRIGRECCTVKNERLRLRINGMEQDHPVGLCLDELLDRLGVSGRWTVVERNGEAILREAFAGLALADGDRLEIVTPVAGG